jgi:hypothetical protein
MNAYLSAAPCQMDSDRGPGSGRNHKHHTGPTVWKTAPSLRVPMTRTILPVPGAVPQPPPLAEPKADNACAQDKFKN